MSDVAPTVAKYWSTVNSQERNYFISPLKVGGVGTETLLRARVGAN